MSLGAGKGGYGTGVGGLGVVVGTGVGEAPDRQERVTNSTTTGRICMSSDVLRFILSLLVTEL
jgi:hypothetical protein